MLSCKLSVLNATVYQTAKVIFGDVALVTRGPLTVECLMETHFSQSLVRMAVLSPVFQHVPKQLFPSLESCGNCHHVGDGVPLCTATSSAMGATLVAVGW